MATRVKAKFNDNSFPDAEAGPVTVEDTPVPLPPPSPLERQILGDWHSFTSVSVIRLGHVQSPYTEFLQDALNVVDAILSMDGVA